MLWMLAAVIWRVNVGLAAFAAGTLLIIAQVADDRDVIARVPWDVILMVTGVTVLIGVLEATGDFQRGEVVACLDPEGRELARGLVNYSSEETRKILRRPSSDIEGILGYVDEPELIHRDNLVLLY